MRDEEIDQSDLPEIPPEAFARALVRKGLEPVVRKAQITLRIDADVFSPSAVCASSQMTIV